MELTKKQERWIKELTELWNFFDQRLKNSRIKATNLRFFLLLSMTVASHRLIRGFFVQLKGGSNDNLDSKLRTLIETLVNIQYILGEETDDRAKAYILNGAASRVNALDRIIRLLEQKKADAWAAINAIEGYKELRREKQQELSELKARFGEENYSWPRRLEQRAGAQGLEEAYATIYWYFSEDTHMTSYGLNRFLSNTEGGIAFSTHLDLSELDAEIQTAYATYLDFIILCSVWLDFPAQEELEKFKSSEMIKPQAE